ncbi:MAG: DUF262 domain-containing protein [Bacteroidales bacterium]|nr:DUF262 domain-containing protein [Bacteroidales bacterium]
MANKINLITGETYTLGELFSGTRRIIIPDLQRDYCWGNKPDGKESKSLVEGFVDTLLEQFKEHPYGKLSLGLLYGYECPSDYVQLCDGQQRITTLFLLLGMLNRWAGDDSFRHYLMSDFEFYDDDHEPYLQYSIRESSLYFMSDLVYRFFTHGSGESLENVKAIYDSATGESCAWFYGEYATDPSIMSMLRCLESIERMKDTILEGGNDKIERLMEFLADRLTFIYYDMENRANGEETFVVINTTGEPLSATENLKPLVINAEINQADKGSYNVNGKTLSTAMAWEEMENYFWKNRRQDKFDTSDNGFQEFLRWVTLLETYNSADTELFKQNAKEDFPFIFPHKAIPLATIIEIYNIFLLFKREFLTDFAIAQTAGNGEKLDQRQLFVLLPLLVHLRNHPTANRRQMIRLGKWLLNLIRIDNVSKTVNSLLSEVIRIGAAITDPTDILDLEGVSATILTEEERFKLDVIKNSPDEESRCDLEEDIWTAQDMRVDNNQLLFSGEIKTLLLWATPGCELSAAEFSAAMFKHYLSALRRLLTTGSHTTNDTTRRALIAWRYKGMPWGKSYGWGGTWKDILAWDVANFRRFIDTSEKFGLNHILKLDSSGNPIARYAGIIGYSDHKNFDTWRVSGYNICLRSYAQPIPVALAAIMARLGAEVAREVSQNCGSLNIYLTKDCELMISPVQPGLRRFDRITVTCIDGGKRLRYYIETPSYDFEIALPLSSAVTLHQRLNPSDKPITLPRTRLKRNHRKAKRKLRK